MLLGGRVSQVWWFRAVVQVTRARSQRVRLAVECFPGVGLRTGIHEDVLFLQTLEFKI